MHDPMTVAFEIRYPWYARGRWPHRRWIPKAWQHPHWRDGYRNACLTIWHNDPEADGSDDSCGWHSPPLTARDRAFAKELADSEEQCPYYFAQPAIHEVKSYKADPDDEDDEDAVDGRVTYQTYRLSPGDCVALVAELYRVCRWRLDPTHRRWGLTPRLMAAAFAVGASEHDNFQSSFALWDDDRRSAYRRRETIEGTFLSVIRSYRRLTRPWWRHPRWHVWHWQLQVHPLQAFKRWAFTRCRACGRRFAWGETGVGTWGGDGPRWFRSETLTHMDCAHGSVPARHEATA